MKILVLTKEEVEVYLKLLLIDERLAIKYGIKSKHSSPFSAIRANEVTA